MPLSKQPRDNREITTTYSGDPKKKVAATAPQPPQEKPAEQPKTARNPSPTRNARSLLTSH